MVLLGDSLDAIRERWKPKTYNQLFSSTSYSPFSVIGIVTGTPEQAVCDVTVLLEEIDRLNAELDRRPA